MPSHGASKCCWRSTTRSPCAHPLVRWWTDHQVLWGWDKKGDKRIPVKGRKEERRRRRREEKTRRKKKRKGRWWRGVLEGLMKGGREGGPFSSLSSTLLPQAGAWSTLLREGVFDFFQLLGEGQKKKECQSLYGYRGYGICCAR